MSAAGAKVLVPERAVFASISGVNALSTIFWAPLGPSATAAVPDAMPYPTIHPPVTLHLGAHRTGCTGLNEALTDPALVDVGIAAWTAPRIRAGLLAGVTGDPGRRDPHRDVTAHRTAGRVALLRQGLAQRGVRRLVVSDPALLGSARENLTVGQLYPTAGARLARLQGALPGIDRICLGLRAPDAWWRNALAHAMSRGVAAPAPEIVAGLARTRRTWRQVIEDLAERAPQAVIHVWAHEETNPADAFEIVTDGQGAFDPERVAGPDLSGSFGQYDPFTARQRAALEDSYAADLDWLRSGADGLARYGTGWPSRATGNDRKGWHDGGRSEGQMGAAG